MSEPTENPAADDNLLRIFPKLTALTIAGSDPSGGAGLQADLKVFQQLGVYGMTAVTLLTVQNTSGVSQVEVLDPRFVIAQINAIFEDIPPRALKTGALGTAAMVREVSDRLAYATCPIVVDPVLVSKHGDPLADQDVVQVMRNRLLSHATLVTPNRHEAALLTGLEIETVEDASKAASILSQFGSKNVLVKFGQVDDRAVHVLGTADGQFTLKTPWIQQPGTHGVRVRSVGRNNSSACVGTLRY